VDQLLKFISWKQTKYEPKNEKIILRSFLLVIHDQVTWQTDDTFACLYWLLVAWCYSNTCTCSSSYHM